MNNQRIIDLAKKRAESSVQKAQETASLPRPQTLSEISSERISEKKLELVAPKTGYPELDSIIKGFVPGHLYTLTGDTNVGKTTLACNFAVRVAKQKKMVLYFALEPGNTVIDYLASVRENKRFDELTDRDLMFDDGTIHVFGKNEVKNIDDLVNIVEKSPTHYDLIIIDHIGYFTGAGNNWLQEQSDAIKKLATLTKVKKTAIMIIAHLRKKMSGQSKSYIPTSDDISGSGAFKQDSTEVMIVTRDLVDPEDGGMQYSNFGKIYVTKTKSGPNGLVHINFTERSANIMTDSEKFRYTNHKRELMNSTDPMMKDIAEALF